MVGRAMDEKRPKYTLGKSRKNGENHWLKKYSDSHWLNTYNDKQGAPGYSLKKQAGETLYGLKLWEQEVARDNGVSADLMLKVFSL